MSQPVNVFVYGTLKPGEANYQSFCAGRVLEARRAVAFGQLFALPFGYPAMTLGENPVHGFLLSFPDETVLLCLDWLEDYQANRLVGDNEYTRQQIVTYSPVDTSLLGTAWVYLMSLEQVQSLGGTLLANGWWSGYGFSAYGL